MVSLDPAIWVAALMTIGIYSLAFRYTKFYKFCEFTFVGLGVGYGIVLSYDNIQRIAIQGIMAGNVSYLIPIILGILLYARYIPQYQWVGRYPLAMMVGIGTGVAVRGYVSADITRQILATLKPLWGPGDPIIYINALIVLVILLSGLTFFIFTIPTHKIPGGAIISKIGRYGLMIYFGAMVGNTVMARYSFLIGRMQFLLFKWLGF